MKATKLFAKICLILTYVSGGLMAFNVFAGQNFESWSLHATSVFDWLLRITLTCGALVYYVLTFRAKDSNNKLNVGWASIKYWNVTLFCAVMFNLISFTNVSDYSVEPVDYSQFKIISHMVFTGLLAVGIFFYCWHFYERKTNARLWSSMSITAGAIGFVLSLITDIWSIGLGEQIFLTMAASVMWPIINEELE